MAELISRVDDALLPPQVSHWTAIVKYIEHLENAASRLCYKSCFSSMMADRDEGPLKAAQICIIQLAVSFRSFASLTGLVHRVKLCLQAVTNILHEFPLRWTIA